MFFSKQSSPATPGKSAVVISPASSLAPSAATFTVPTLPTQSGLFSKWQRPSVASSASSVSTIGQPTVTELLKKNSMLVDQVDGLKHAVELNQLTTCKLAKDLEAKQRETAQLRDSNRSLNIQLKSAKQDDQTIVLQKEVRNLSASRSQLVQERDKMSNEASTLNAQRSSLQQENDALTSKLKQYESQTTLLMHQIQSYTKLSTQRQQSSIDKVDTIYTQQVQIEQRTAEQLKAKDAIIRNLQAQLKKSELAASKAIVSRDDGIDTLSAQLKRSDIDRDGLARLADQWQDCSNDHLARVRELEEQLKKLMARSV